MISKLFSLIARVPIQPLVFFGVALLAYGRKKLKKGGLKLPGSSKKPPFKKVGRVKLGKAIAPQLMKSGDYGYVAQNSKGQLAVIAGDWVKPGGPKYETAVFLMDDFGATPEFVAGRRGKCTGAVYINDQLHLIITDKGSLWEGTRNPRLYKLVGNKLVRIASWSFQGIAGSSHLDVNWAFVKQGWNQKYMGDRIYVTAVRASKTVFDDWKPVGNVPGSGQIKMFSAPVKQMLNQAAWKPEGAVLEVDGKTLYSPRNKHINGAEIAFDEVSGSYILFLADFNQKTQFVYQKSASAVLTQGYRRIAYPASVGAKSSQWHQVHKQLGLAAKKTAKLRHDTHYQGISWTASLGYSKKYGAFIGVGGWENEYDRCAQIQVTIS